MNGIGLDFEKPIVELERKIDELKQLSSDEKMNLSGEIKKLEDKLEKVKKDIYENLSPWQRVQIARCPKRPFTLDYINTIMTDFVEVHGAHGFLLSEFLSPYTNRRSDAYGGSFENRCRFPLEVVSKVRQAIGQDFILFYRLGADDLIPGGLTIRKSARFASLLASAGVDCIDVSGGLCGSRPEHLQSIQGYFVPLAEAIKREVDIPVIVAGGITEPEFADELIRARKVDLAAIGRAQLKDPDWAARAREVLG